MKKSYRLAQEAVYAAALKGIGITPKKVTAHRDASATVKANEKQVEKVKTLAGVEIIHEGKGEVTLRLPAAIEYHNANPPLRTEAEWEALRQEAQERQAKRDARRALEAAELGEGAEEGFDASETDAQ